MKTIYHTATGEAFEREPVDANEMLASGQYQSEPPTEEQMAEAAAKAAEVEDVVVRKAATKAAPKKSGK